MENEFEQKVKELEKVLDEAFDKINPYRIQLNHLQPPEGVTGQALRHWLMQLHDTLLQTYGATTDIIKRNE